MENLIERTKAIRIGDPLDEETQMGPLVSAAHREKVLGYMRRGKEEGARLVAGGGEASLQGFEGGCFVEPTIFTDVTDSMTIAREEIFGPVMCVLDFADEEEVIARANATDLGLSAGVFTQDLAQSTPRDRPPGGRFLLDQQL